MTLNGVEKFEVDYYHCIFKFKTHNGSKIFEVIHEIVTIYYDEFEHYISFDTLYGHADIDIKDIIEIYFYDKFGREIPKRRFINEL